MPARTQLLAQLAVVVDLSIEREDVAAIVRKHRFVTTGRSIDNRQPSMAQTRAPSGRIDRRGHPNTLVVAPAMLDTFEHRLDQPFWFEAYNPRNPTHRLDLERAALAQRIEYTER